MPDKKNAPSAADRAARNIRTKTQSTKPVAFDPDQDAKAKDAETNGGQEKKPIYGATGKVIGYTIGNTLYLDGLEVPIEDFDLDRFLKDGTE